MLRVITAFLYHQPYNFDFKRQLHLIKTSICYRKFFLSEFLIRHQVIIPLVARPLYTCSLPLSYLHLSRYILIIRQNIIIFFNVHIKPYRMLQTKKRIRSIFWMEKSNLVFNPEVQKIMI